METNQLVWSKNRYKRGIQRFIIKREPRSQDIHGSKNRRKKSDLCGIWDLFSKCTNTVSPAGIQTRVPAGSALYHKFPENKKRQDFQDRSILQKLQPADS